MRQATREEEFDSLIAEKKTVAAVFTATWCPDCRVIKPVMPEVAAEFETHYDFIEIDRDTLPDLYSRFEVTGIPSFIIFDDGREVDRWVSRDRKTRAEIEEFFRRNTRRVTA